MNKWVALPIFSAYEGSLSLQIRNPLGGKKKLRKTKTENSKVSKDQNIKSLKFMIVLERDNFISVIR